MGFIRPSSSSERLKKQFLNSPISRLLRPRQWTKNLIVFGGPLFGYHLEINTLSFALISFLCLCSVSSSFYVINDILDVEADRRHPIKRNRPIASGDVSISTAFFLATFLLLSALFSSFFFSIKLGFIILAYALLQVLYNFQLKHQPIWDLVAISMGFVLRATAGSIATKIYLSPWFLLCVSLLSLFLAVEKRKAELRLCELCGIEPRKVLRRYSFSLLSRIESTATTGAFMSYALWSAGPSLGGASTPWMMITLPFVLFGIFRYQLLSDPSEINRRLDSQEDVGGKTERPEEILLQDKPILITVVGWVISCFIILTLKNHGLIS